MIESWGNLLTSISSIFLHFLSGQNVLLYCIGEKSGHPVRHEDIEEESNKAVISCTERQGASAEGLPGTSVLAQPSTRTFQQFFKNIF